MNVAESSKAATTETFEAAVGVWHPPATGQKNGDAAGVAETTTDGEEAASHAADISTVIETTKDSTTMKDQIQTCGNCRYFDGLPNSGGKCHANPPVVGFDRNGDYHDSFRPDVWVDETACRFFEQNGGV